MNINLIYKNLLLYPSNINMISAGILA